MSSTLVSPPVVKARSLSCPNCGAAVELRGFAHTLTADLPALPELAGCDQRRVPNPADLPGKAARAAEDPAGIARAVWRHAFRSDRLPAARRRRGRRFLLLGRVSAVQPVSRLPVSDRIPGPLEFRAGDERAARSGSVRQQTRVRVEGRTYTHFIQCDTPAPDLSSANFLGRFEWETRPDARTSSRRLTCFRRKRQARK